MFLVIVKKLRTFQLPMFCEMQVHEKLGREHGWSNTAKLASGVFRIIQRHAQYIDEGWLGSRGCPSSETAGFSPPGSLAGSGLG